MVVEWNRDSRKRSFAAHLRPDVPQPSEQQEVRDAA